MQVKPNAIKSAMIRSAVKKGISDIKDNAQRGIRNLVELGELFAGGRFQKDFFQTVMAQLRDEGSAYYRLIERVVHTMDAQMLAQFGINLGYNALSHGAGIIRGIEEREGFNVPWCLVVDAGEGSGALPPADIERVMEEGKALGIYCYLFVANAAYPFFDELMEVAARQKECAIVLFTGAQRVSQRFCEDILRARHIVPLIDLGVDDPGANDVAKAAALLLQSGCFCGGFVRDADLRAEDVGPALLEAPKALGLPVLVFVREKKHHPQFQDDVNNKFVLLRENLKVPVLPIDLYEDIAHADRAISTEACLATLRSDGALTFTNVDEEEVASACNIRSCSLAAALRRSLPKGFQPEGQ